MIAPEIRAHGFYCANCGAQPGQWCLITPDLRVWSVVHVARQNQVEFADALDLEREAIAAREAMA